MQYLAHNSSAWSCKLCLKTVHPVVAISAIQLFVLRLKPLPDNGLNCCNNICQTTVQAELSNSVIQRFWLLILFLADNCSGWSCKLCHLTVQTVVSIYCRHLIHYCFNTCSGWKRSSKLCHTIAQNVVAISIRQMFRLKFKSLPFNSSNCWFNIWQTTVYAHVANFATQLLTLFL